MSAPQPEPQPCNEVSITKGGKIFVCHEADHPPGQHYFTREG